MTIPSIRTLKFLVLLPLLPGCGSESSPTLAYGGGNHQITVRSRDLVRRAIVHIPGSISEGQEAPLLVVLHGTGGNGAGMQVATEMDSYADAMGLIVAYPDAISGLWTITLAETLDMEFVEDLVDEIGRDLLIDRSRVYLTGFSRGALLAMKMACQRKDLVAAVAPVGAPVRTDIVGDCQAGGPVPAIFILGTEDQFYSWAGSVSEGDTIFGGVESGEWWAEKNGCDTDPSKTALPDTSDDGTTVQRWVYGSCPPNGPLEFYAVEGGDHTWPGSSFDQGFLGRVSFDIVASEMITGFLRPISR